MFFRSQGSGPQPFSHDIKRQRAFLYTRQAPYSALVANQRITLETLKIIPNKKLRVMDAGCGDGTYTLELAQARPRWQVSGSDASKAAVTSAQKYDPTPGRYSMVDLMKQPKVKGRKRYDWVILRGVIHHIPDPEVGLSHALQMADNILIIEPNGNNPLLKIIENISPYHRSHGERSFQTQTLRQWSEKSGGGVKHVGFIGIVPFFCPTWMTKILQAIEPVVEKSFFAPVLCAQQILIIQN